MDLTPINRTPIGAAARGVGRATFGALTTLGSGAMAFSGRLTHGYTLMVNRTKIDYAAAGGDPLRNSIVMAVVGWIARNFPEARVQITHLVDGHIEKITPGIAGPGAMLKLLDRPNRYFSGVLLWKAVITDLFLTGNAYILKQRSANGRVIALWWVPKRFIRPAWPNDGSVFISHYIYTVDGVEYGIAERDVIHLRDGIDPNNTRLGLSKTASLLREIYTDDEASNFTATLLTNLGVPGVIIAPANTTQGTMKVDPESVKRTFMEKFSGDKRGEPMVLTSPTEMKVLSWSPEQMNLRDIRKIPEERVSAVYGIAAIVAGLGAGLDRSTFSNFGEARKAAYEESVIPTQGLVSAELKVQLLPEFASEEQIDREVMEVGFDLSNVRALAEAADAVWKRHESAGGKGMVKRSEFKRAVGLPVDPGGADEVYIIPGNYLILPAGGDTPPSGTRTSFVTGERPMLTGTTPLLLEAGDAEPVRCSSCDKMLGKRSGALTGGTLEVKCSRCGAVNDVAA